MKHLSPLLFLLFLSAGTAQAQTDHCDKFNTLLEKAKTLWAQKKFEDAFAKLSAAREACPGRAAEVDTRYADFIRDIAGKYETADVKTREAKREAERALTATRLAERNATRSDSIADAAERAARRAYANDLAYKSTIALRDGDRNTAFRLAEFAHRYVEADNPKVVQALIDALYYNDNPDPAHPPLPRVANLEGHTHDVNCVAFSPDGKRLATGSNDYTAKIWDLESANALTTLEGHTDEVTSVAFSPDGKRLATGSEDNSAKIWDLESANALTTLQGHIGSVWSVAFSPDGKRLATGSTDNTAKIWDIESANALTTLEGHTDAVRSVAFSLDGKRLATGSDDNSAKIWDLQSAKALTTLEGHRHAVRSVAFSPDGKRLATGSEDNTAKIWNLESANALTTLEGHFGAVRSVAFSPDGNRLATGSQDFTTKIWDLQSAKALTTLEGHTSEVTSVAFSHDGNRLATGSSDFTAKIWDLQSAKALTTLEGHTSFVLSVAFSPDGKTLATGCWDNTAKIWDLHSGKALATLQGHTTAVRSVAFSPDGNRLATGSDDKTAKIWDLSGDALLQRWQFAGGRAGLTLPLLQRYNLDALLDQQLDNEQRLLATREVWQISAFAELYAQNTRNSQQLTRTARDYTHAARLYQAAYTASGDPGFTASLGQLYQNWAEAILESGRPDTAGSYIELACRLGLDKSECPRLWAVFSEKANKPFDFNRFLTSEDVEELRGYGDFFFEDTLQWDKARQLYEKAESKKHTAVVQQNLFAISEKTGKAFDFQRFLASEEVEELRSYGDFFFRDTLQRDKARQLYDKAESKQHSAVVLQNLFAISEKAGKAFDFQRFLASEDVNELYGYATFFIQKANDFEKFKDWVPDYQNAIRLREKQMTLDTSTTLRITASNDYNRFGYYQLFLPDGLAAEASLRRSLELDPTNKFPYTKLATALMLQGKDKEAEAEYKKWAPLPFNESNPDRPTYREAFLYVLKIMEEQGVPGFDFARVRGWLGE